MKHIILLFLIFLFPFTALTQFTSQPYHQRTDFLLTSPGAMKFGLYGYDNPAMLAYVEDFDFLLHFSDQGGFNSFDRWGIFAATEYAGFSALRNNIGSANFNTYSYAMGYGNASSAFGLSYNWHTGDTDILGLESYVTAGSVIRPNRYLSLGLMGSASVESEDYEGVIDLAVRPLGDPRIALFGDYAIQSGVKIQDATWSAGVAVEAVPGVRLTGRYIHDFGVTAGVQFSFGNAGVSAQSHFDSDMNQQFNTYGLRIGAYDRNVIETYTQTDENYLSLSLRGPMAYQTREWFDKRNTLQHTLTSIREAKTDPRISGIVINTTGMAISSTMIWEIRDELEQFKESGKKVIVYIERGGMSTMHLASVADYVVMDPMGSLMITGYATSTTYFKELLDYIGIGVDEFREMTHKSAFESFARAERSDADAEQRNEILDGYYNVTKNDVTRGRNISSEDYDELINNGLALSPQDLVNIGLVDTLARATEMNNLIEHVDGEKRKRIGSDELLVNKNPSDDFWGKKPQIAILYAIGGTQVEGGIRARLLAREIRKARNDDNIKAIVLRADSPGGDALASDLVSAELKKAMEDNEKPVIVSMGSVAASGGYWISMYSDSIVVAPNTVTGSIGVISGWFYDDGVVDRFRLNYNAIARGSSADLMTSPAGLLPGRNLTEDERERLINRMMSLYDDFIEKVADGRNMEFDEVKTIAEGRVWTGVQAVDNGLADEIGNLSFAVALALEKAGMHPDDVYEIVEGPSLSRFDLFDILPLPSLLRTWLSEDEQNTMDPMMDYLKLMMEYNAHPLLMLPMEDYQMIYNLTK